MVVIGCSFLGMRNLVGLFLVLIGSISSDVIGWCYTKFQSVLGLRTKECFWYIYYRTTLSLNLWRQVYC